MNGKDINDVKDSLLTVRFAFQIPFTKTILFFCTGRINIKPHEHQPDGFQSMREDYQLEGQSREGLSIARAKAARYLNCPISDVAAGFGKVNVWVRWYGMTWNAATWSKVLTDIAFYAKGKKSRTRVADDEYSARFGKAHGDRFAKQMTKKILKQNEPGGKN